MEEDYKDDIKTRGAFDLADIEYATSIQSWFKQSDKKEADMREESEEDFKFYSGHQWEENAKATMRQERRPALTLNYVLPIINAVIGEERQNRQEIKVYGRDPDDDAGAFAMSELIRWVMDTCNGEYEISKAFKDMIICGRGYIEITIDYSIDPTGEIRLGRVKPSEIYVDPVSEREDLYDARYVIREKYLTEDQIAATFGEDKVSLIKGLHGDQTNKSSVEHSFKGDDYSYGGRVFRSNDGTYQVLEVWHSELVEGALVQNPQTGKTEELTIEELEAVLKETAQQQEAQGQPVAETIDYIKRPIKQFFHGFVCGSVTLLKEPSPHTNLKSFPIIPIFGLRDDEDESWFGIVKSIKDAQRQHNVEQSSLLHWVQTQPKSGWIAPRGAFVDKRRWEQRSSQAGFIGEYNATRGMPQQLRAMPLPRHILEMAQTRLQNMRDISGVNVELLGSSPKDTAGIVMQMRQRQGMTILETYFDNLRLTRRLIGTVLISMIQQYIADDRKVRIMGERGARYVQATTDLQFGKFDAIVEDSTDTPNDKMATMYILQTTLPMLLQAGVPVPPSFVDILPISQHIKDEWKQMLENMMNQQPQPEQPQ